MKILYVEDDPEAREFVQKALAQHGCVVDLAGSGAAGLERATEGAYDILVLDVMLPDLSGFEVLRRLRALGVATPALFLTAQGDVSHRIEGLNLGADDYLAKPFAFAELLARIRAIARRSLDRPPADRLELADLVVDVKAHRVERAGRRIDLTPKEFNLLAYLVQNAGHVVSRTMLVEKVWGWGFDAHNNVIDVHVNRLRKKVDRAFGVKLIHTVKGIGYVAEDRGEDAAAEE
ncbi:MAG TPA: response regulator transcription factor [Myxococcota bacterium]|nr:response regulator transcription factor [Myxococcota bacterium]